MFNNLINTKFIKRLLINIKYNKVRFLILLIFINNIAKAPVMPLKSFLFLLFLFLFLLLYLLLILAIYYIYILLKFLLKLQELVFLNR
jgi:hypothetical protein